MRKVKLQMQMSLDGYVARPNEELDWMTWDQDDKLIAFINTLIDSSDTILLGRKMTDGFVSHWENALKNNADTPFAKKWLKFQKLFSPRHLTNQLGTSPHWQKGILQTRLPT